MEAILHRFDSDTTTPIDSSGYGFIKNAASLQVLAMVHKANLRHDASESWARKGWKVELSTSSDEVRKYERANASVEQFSVGQVTTQV